MGRIVHKEIANIVKNKHQKNCVKVHLNTKSISTTKIDDGYEINRSDNSLVKCDMIIVGIGAMPNIDIFKDSPLKIDNGILTDQNNKTSIENVFAAGDVANFFHPLYEENIRLESWKHAQNHGVAAGKNIKGMKTEYRDIHGICYEKQELKLQITGRGDKYDSLSKRGKEENEGIIYFFIKKNKIGGACGLGIGGKIGKDIRFAGMLSEKKVEIEEDFLSDPSSKLNKLLKK